MDNSDIMTKAEKIAEHAHNEAKGYIPDVSVDAIFEVLLDVLLKKTSAKEAAKKIAGPYKEAVPKYIKCFINVAKSDCLNDVRSSIITYVNEFLSNSNIEEISKLSDTDFAKKLEASSEKIILLSFDFMRGKIPAEKFVEKLGTTGIKEPVNIFISSLVPDELKNINIARMDSLKIADIILTKISAEKIVITAFSCMAIAGFSGAFLITSKYLKEDWLSYENRLKIQQENDVIIEKISEYRKQLNSFVDAYLVEHITVYQQGFQAMDRAIAKHDTDGFISANVTIQEALGYDVQFRNQSEFDGLMNSSETIKL